MQPTLSSYFTLAERAPAGIYEMLAYNEQRAEQLVSRTAIERLDLVLSNDDRGELNTLLLHAPDGRLRLRHLLPTLAPHYDLLLIDTQGARSAAAGDGGAGLELGAFAGDAGNPRGARAAARHAATHRGHRAVPPPRHRAAAAAPAHQPRASGVVECAADPAGAASGIPEQPGVRVPDTDVPAIEAYPRAATRGLPVHRVEYRQPAGRTAPAALETMRALAGELFPAWQERFALVTGRGDAGGAGHGQRT